MASNTILSLSVFFAVDWDEQGRHLGGGAGEVYGPPRIYDFFSLLIVLL